jgi:hypothetical protein
MELHRIQFAGKFKYLDSLITPLLNEVVKIDVRIKNAKSIMGFLSTFLIFRMQTIDSNIKYTLQEP